MKFSKLLIFYFFFCGTVLFAKETLQIAVASNFLGTLQVLKSTFLAQYKAPIQIQISHASSKKLASQILLGAPYDLFLSADEVSIQALLKNNMGHKDSIYVYALGQLIFFSPDPQAQPFSKALKACQKITIANPKMAPYGYAAQQVLHHYNYDLQDLSVLYAQNINQSLQFSLAKPMCAFLAQSQRKYIQGKEGSVFSLDPSLYSPIRQQLIALNSKQLSRDFLNFMKSSTAKAIIESHGYQLEEELLE